MGCCHSDDAVSETSPLLDDNAGNSTTVSAKTPRKKSMYIDKPNCDLCSSPMNLYELQCCYLNKTNESLFSGNIDCQECQLGMHGETTLLWHCMNKHEDDYKYDLCLDCAETVFNKQQQTLSEKEIASKTLSDYDFDDSKMKIVFDPKYNVKNEINWNVLWNILADEGKILFVLNRIHDFTDKHANYKEILSPKILNWIEIVENQKEEVMASHDRLHKHDGWTIQVDDCDDISIWYKQIEGSAIHSVKSRILMKCTALDIICVLNEFDLMADLISMIPIRTVLLKEESITTKVIYIKADLWFPLKNRDVVAKSSAFDLVTEMGEILINGASIDPHDIEFDDDTKIEDGIMNCDSHTVRMVAKQSEGVIKPIRFGTDGNDLTEVISIMNIDPQSFVPTALLNWATRTLAFYQAKMIRSRCENLQGTKHAKRVATKPIYRKWKKDMKMYIAELRKQEKIHELQK